MLKNLAARAARLFGQGAVFGFGLCASMALAQFTIPDLTTVVGHIASAAPAAIPTGTTCTIAAGSSDFSGNCATTGATATVTFGRSWGVAPNCLVVDATATSTVSMPVYTVSATAITFTTVITAHTLRWNCVGIAGTA